MVRVVTHRNASAHQSLLEGMHRDRKRVFIDIMGWDLPHTGEREVDQFDDEQAEYLIVADRVTGDHLASLRLLRTDRPHLMGEVFPFLCEAEIPRGVNVREITRLCLSPRLRASDRRRARNALAQGLIQYALHSGVRALTGVSDRAFLLQVLEAGWDCVPLGQLHIFGGSHIGAFQINIAPDTLSLLKASWRSETIHLPILEMDEPLAA